MLKLRTWTTMFMVALGVTACAIEPEGMLSPESRTPEPAADQEGDITITPQFDLQLLPAGQLRPGQIRLNAIVRANIAAPNFRFRVVAPDVEIAKANGWTARRAWSASTFPAVAQFSHGLGRGQSLNHNLVLDVPSVGYYRIILTAATEELQPQIVNGNIVHNIAQKEFWLWVDEEGGTITSEFERSRIPAGYIGRPGPLTRIPSRQARGLAPAWSPSTEIQVRYYHSNPDSGLIPHRDARVVMKIYDQYEGRYVWEGDLFTDGSGNFTADCPYPGSYDTNEYYIYAEDSYSRVLPGTSLASFSTHSGDPLCDNATNLIQVGEWARVFDYFKHIVPNSRTLFGFTRGRIDVRPHFYPDKASFTSGNNSINFPSGYIWGPSGYFYAAHEYGHALHHQALGGLNPGWTSCPDPHQVLQASEYGCALSEGFANFHAVYVGGIRSAWYQTIVALTGGLSVGPKVEGAVAAFFFDLVDGSGTFLETSESHDTTQYPGSYVATIMKTCKYNTSSRASGIDHIVYCLERSLSSRTGHHWSDRPAVSNFVEAATEPSGWSPAAIYNNWHWDIYRH